LRKAISPDESSWGFTSGEKSDMRVLPGKENFSGRGRKNFPTFRRGAAILKSCLKTLQFREERYIYRSKIVEIGHYF
jgi:hypothetical protein